MKPVTNTDEPIRVLHCLWSGATGGAERSVYQLARAQIADPEIAPGLLFAQGRGPYWERSLELGCPVASLDMPSGRSLSHVGRAAEVMRDFSVHHFHSAELILMLASLRCPDARRVWTHRGGRTDYPLRRRARYEIAGHMLRRNFHGFSGNSAHAVDFSSELFRLDPARYVVTYNGLDFGLLEPTREGSAVREELGLEPDHFVVGTSAHLRPWKRIELLLEATHALQRPELRVLVLGDGPDRPRLEAITRDLGFESSVVFAGMRQHVGDYLQVMNAFCLPSNAEESFGNAAVEAMGMGVPTTVFSDSPGLTEHIDPGRTGIVVEDGHQLRESLTALIDDPRKARALGEAGCAAVRERYGMVEAERRYRRLYRSVCSGAVNGAGSAEDTVRH